MSAMERATGLGRAPMLRVATWCAYASGLVTVFGIAFLLVFFAGVEAAGPINDVAVVIQYGLLIPITVALHALLRKVDPGRSARSLAVGLVGIAIVIVSQVLLLLEALPFGAYFPLVSLGFFVTLAWFLMNRTLGGDRGIVPDSLLLTVFAGLYFGYPVWAFGLAARLRETP